MIEVGDRIVIAATNQEGIVVGEETAHGNPDSVWAERLLHVQLDDNPLCEVAIRDIACAKVEA